MNDTDIPSQEIETAKSTNQQRHNHDNTKTATKNDMDLIITASAPTDTLPPIPPISATNATNDHHTKKVTDIMSMEMDMKMDTKTEEKSHPSNDDCYDNNNIY